MNNSIRWPEGQPDPDQVEMDAFAESEIERQEREEAHDRDEEAIAAGEARYRESLLADEIGIGYANPDYLDSNEDFPGDDL